MPTKLWTIVCLASARAVVLLDHLNLNHQKGRHDLLNAFYFDVLNCAQDPRKRTNLDAGRGSVWANAGLHQFHLGEAEEAQTFHGVISLAYENLDRVRDRLAAPPAALKGTRFGWEERHCGIHLTDPWGSHFRLHEGARDPRGAQPGDASEPCALTDLLVHVPADANLDGLSRFYGTVLGCAVHSEDGGRVVVSTGAAQTLSFAAVPPGADCTHDEVRLDDEGRSMNDGVHISLYVRDLPTTYAAAEALGVTYVNHRFKRRAYTLPQAVEQCMFRILDVVDPEAPHEGPILRLEHEVRSCVTADGTKYKSCPLDLSLV